MVSKMTEEMSSILEVFVQGKTLPRWDEVLDFLRTEEEESSRVAKKRLLESSDMRNAGGRTLLHWVCMNRPPVNVVAAIVDLAPNTPQILDDRFGGRTPLHMACKHGSSLDVIQFLVKNGGGQQAVLAADNFGVNPLHLASSNLASLDVVKFLVEEGGNEAVLARTNSGFTPLHRACESGASLEIVRFLTERGGSEVLQPTKGYGSTPLHWACRSAATCEVIQFLVETGGEEILNLADSNDGRTPLHWAARFHNSTSPGVIAFLIAKGGGELVMQKDHYDKYAADYVFYVPRTEKVEIMRKEFFRSTMLMLQNHATGVRPMAPETVPIIQLYSLQTMEKDVREASNLQNTPLARKTVQALCNKVFILRPTLLFIVMDLYVQILLSVAFSVGSGRRILGNGDDVPQWTLTALWFCLIWQVLREILQIAAVSARTWAFDIWNWVDFGQILFVSISFRTFNRRGEVLDWERVILTAAAGLIRINFLKISKNFFFGISVFVYAMRQIVGELVPFLITTAVVTNAFIHMYHVAGKGTVYCESEDPDDLPMGCDSSWNIWSLYSTLFAMLFSGVEVHVYQNPIATVLSYSFAFVIGLIFLNVLIAKINNVFFRIEQEGKMVFFANRVSTALEIYSTFSLLGALVPGGSRKDRGSRNDEGSRNDRDSQSDGKDLKPSFGADWETMGGRRLMAFYREDLTENIWRNSETRLEALCTTLVLYIARLLVPFVLVLVFFMGFLSLGLLWPRWMKAYLFFGVEEDVNKDMEQVKGEMATLRSEWKKDLTQLQKRHEKLQSGLKNNLKEIRDLVLAARS